MPPILRTLLPGQCTKQVSRAWIPMCARCASHPAIQRFCWALPPRWLPRGGSMTQSRVSSGLRHRCPIGCRDIRTLQGCVGCKASAKDFHEASTMPSPCALAISISGASKLSFSFMPNSGMRRCERLRLAAWSSETTHCSRKTKQRYTPSLVSSTGRTHFLARSLQFRMRQRSFDASGICYVRRDFKKRLPQSSHG